MDKRHCIESGILERFVLGNVSDQESAEVQCMSRIYPEIKQELKIIEADAHKYAFAHSAQPPAHLKQTILEKIKTVPQNNQQLSVKSTSEQDSGTKRMNSSWLKAAIILFFVGIGAILALYTTSSNQFQNEIAGLHQELSGLQSDLAELTTDAERTNQLIAAIRSEDFSNIRLEGLEQKEPEATASIYWNEGTKEVFFTNGSFTGPLRR